jgi:hypothetical protein
MLSALDVLILAFGTRALTVHKHTFLLIFRLGTRCVAGVMEYHHPAIPTLTSTCLQKVTWFHLPPQRR